VHGAEDPREASHGSFSGAAAANASENDEPMEEEPVDSSIASLPDSVGAPDVEDETLQPASKRLPDTPLEQDTVGLGRSRGLLEAAGADVIVDLAAADASPDNGGHAMDDEEDMAEASVGAVSAARSMTAESFSKEEVLDRWANLTEALLEVAPDSDEEFVAAKARSAANAAAAEAETRTREVEAMPDADEDDLDLVAAKAAPDAKGEGHPSAVEPARAGSDGLGSNYSSETAEEETAATPSMVTKPATPVDTNATVPAPVAGGPSIAVRWKRVEADIESLSRCLTMLRDVREKQSKCLRLLQGCN